MLLEPMPGTACDMEAMPRPDSIHPMANYRTGRSSSFSDRSTDSPSSDKVSSAADAMLKLSTSFAFFAGDHASGVKTEPMALQPFSDEETHSESGLKAEQYHRRERAFVPEVKKDDRYWTKRRKNNEAAKKSREKRRMQDQLLAHNVAELKKENDDLRLELEQMKRHYGYPVNVRFDPNLGPLERNHIKPIIVQPFPDNSVSVPSPKNSVQSPPPVSFKPLAIARSEIPATNDHTTVAVNVMAVSHHSPQTRISNGHNGVDYERVSDGELKRRDSCETALDYSSPCKARKVDEHKHIDCTNAPPSGGGDKVESTRAQERKGIPHKLRHKYNSMSFVGSTAEDMVAGIEPCTRGDSEPEIPTASGESHFASHSDSDASCADDAGRVESAYAEKRRRNNLAARRCREHKRMLARMQASKADLLEEENCKLKGEMQHLSGEVHYLKELIRKKAQAQTSGVPFETPVHLLDKLDQRDNA